MEILGGKDEHQHFNSSCIASDKIVRAISNKKNHKRLGKNELSDACEIIEMKRQHAEKLYLDKVTVSDSFCTKKCVCLSEKCFFLNSSCFFIYSEFSIVIFQSVDKYRTSITKLAVKPIELRMSMKNTLLSLLYSNLYYNLRKFMQKLDLNFYLNRLLRSAREYDIPGPFNHNSTSLYKSRNEELCENISQQPLANMVIQISKDDLNYRQCVCKSSSFKTLRNPNYDSHLRVHLKKNNKISNENYQSVPEKEPFGILGVLKYSEQDGIEMKSIDRENDKDVTNSSKNYSNSAPSVLSIAQSDKDAAGNCTNCLEFEDRSQFVVNSANFFMSCISSLKCNPRVALLGISLIESLLFLKHCNYFTTFILNVLIKSLYLDGSLINRLSSSNYLKFLLKKYLDSIDCCTDEKRISNRKFLCDVCHRIQLILSSPNLQNNIITKNNLFFHFDVTKGRLIEQISLLFDYLMRNNPQENLLDCEKDIFNGLDSLIQSIIQENLLSHDISLISPDRSTMGKEAFVGVSNDFSESKNNDIVSNNICTTCCHTSFNLSVERSSIDSPTLSSNLTDLKISNISSDLEKDLHCPLPDYSGLQENVQSDLKIMDQNLSSSYKFNLIKLASNQTENCISWNSYRQILRRDKFNMSSSDCQRAIETNINSTRMLLDMSSSLTKQSNLADNKSSIRESEAYKLTNFWYNNRTPPYCTLIQFPDSDLTIKRELYIEMLQRTVQNIIHTTWYLCRTNYFNILTRLAFFAYRGTLYDLLLNSDNLKHLINSHLYDNLLITFADRVEKLVKLCDQESNIKMKYLTDKVGSAIKGDTKDNSNSNRSDELDSSGGYDIVLYKNNYQIEFLNSSYKSVISGDLVYSNPYEAIIANNCISNTLVGANVETCSILENMNDNFDKINFQTDNSNESKNYTKFELTFSSEVESTDTTKSKAIFSKKYIEEVGVTKSFAIKRITLYKTEMCRSFTEIGSCKYGDKCQFCHSVDELRVIQRHPKYKTEICKTFWNDGSCPYGSRCCFLHLDKKDGFNSNDARNKGVVFSSFNEDTQKLINETYGNSRNDSLCSLGDRIAHASYSSSRTSSYNKCNVSDKQQSRSSKNHPSKWVKESDRSSTQRETANYRTNNNESLLLSISREIRKKIETPLHKHRQDFGAETISAKSKEHPVQNIKKSFSYNSLCKHQIHKDENFSKHGHLKASNLSEPAKLQYKTKANDISKNLNDSTQSECTNSKVSTTHSTFNNRLEMGRLEIQDFLNINVLDIDKCSFDQKNDRSSTLNSNYLIREKTRDINQKIISQTKSSKDTLIRKILQQKYKSDTEDRYLTADLDKNNLNGLLYQISKIKVNRTFEVESYRKNTYENHFRLNEYDEDCILNKNYSKIWTDDPLLFIYDKNVNNK